MNDNKRPIAFICGTGNNAVAAVVADWGWRKLGVDLWESLEGEEVRYVYSAASLAGHRNAPLYKVGALGWRSDVWEIRARIENNNIWYKTPLILSAEHIESLSNQQFTPAQKAAYCAAYRVLEGID